MKTVKDIEEEHKWKWQHDYQKKELHVKRDAEAHAFHEKVENNAMPNDHSYTLNKHHLSANFVGILVFFLLGNFKNN